MKTIELIYFNAGGGHRAAAQALQAVMLEQRRPWNVRLVNLFEVLDPQGLFRRITGMAPEDYYNKRLARGWTLGLAQELKLLQGLIRMTHATLLRQLEGHWLASEPDMVVSLIPNFNRVLCESLAAALPGVPYVTVITDLADHPPHFWIEPGLPQHIVCGTPKAVAQAREAGIDSRFIHLSSGMILRPDFYRPPPPDRAARRVALGLPADTPTGVVLFGGQGSNVMQRIATLLPSTPLILLCGHNRALAARLRALPATAPRVVVEYTADVAGHLHLGDFFIGKPGPASVSEALHCGLPVIVTRNALTMPQERYNTDWVHGLGVGRVLKSFAGIADAVDEVRRNLPELRARVRQLDNRAVFEVPEILADIQHSAAAVRPWPRLQAIDVASASH
jgi:hypothetical protein